MYHIKSWVSKSSKRIKYSKNRETFVSVLMATDRVALQTAESVPENTRLVVVRSFE